MSEIFLWRTSDKYACYIGKTDSDERKVTWHIAGLGEPLPPLEKWDAPMLTQYLGDGKKPRKPKN